MKRILCKMFGHQVSWYAGVKAGLNRPLCKRCGVML